MLKKLKVFKLRKSALIVVSALLVGGGQTSLASNLNNELNNIFSNHLSFSLTPKVNSSLSAIPTATTSEEKIRDYLSKIKVTKEVHNINIFNKLMEEEKLLTGVGYENIKPIFTETTHSDGSKTTVDIRTIVDSSTGFLVRETIERKSTPIDSSEQPSSSKRLSDSFSPKEVFLNIRKKNPELFDFRLATLNNKLAAHFNETNLNEAEKAEYNKLPMDESRYVFLKNAAVKHGYIHTDLKEIEEYSKEYFKNTFKEDGSFKEPVNGLKEMEKVIGFGEDISTARESATDTYNKLMETVEGRKFLSESFTNNSFVLDSKYLGDKQRTRLLKIYMGEFERIAGADGLFMPDESVDKIFGGVNPITNVEKTSNLRDFKRYLERRKGVYSELMRATSEEDKDKILKENFDMMYIYPEDLNAEIKLIDEALAYLEKKSTGNDEEDAKISMETVMNGGSPVVSINEQPVDSNSSEGESGNEDGNTVDTSNSNNGSGNVGGESEINMDEVGDLITNVRNGRIAKNSKDAVNGGQLYAVKKELEEKINHNSRRIDNLERKVEENKKEMRAGIAGAYALHGIPQASSPGESMIGVGLGNFKGANAIAIGVSKRSENGRVVFKLSGSANTNKDFGFSTGIGISF